MRSVLAVLALLVAVTTTRADVTVRYSMNIEPGSAVPRQAAEQMTTQMRDMLGETGYQIKGNRARSTGMGATSITDFDGAIISLVDEKKKRYATASQKQYMQAIKDRSPKAADQEKMLANLQMETTAKKTDRTREIHGIKAEETEVVMTMQVPGMPFRVQALMSVWAPAASEKHPAIAELVSYSQRAWDGTNVASTFQALLGQMPGAGSGMLKLVEALKETGLLLEMNATMSMPGFREMLAKMAPEAATAFPEGGDDVLMKMNQKLEEISTAELPESLFVVPRDYTAVDLIEMIGQMMPARQRQ